MRAVGVLVAAGLLLSGCADDDEPGAAPAPGVIASPTPSPTPSSAGPDPAVVGANELGRAPVLMYHQVIADPRKDYDRTPAEFRAELQTLYDEGYRPVTAHDFVTGEIDLPAGTHPVVLTFDDSTVSQARIDANGDPAPDTALGILEAFGKRHPDFKPTGTFFVNTFPAPFVDDAVLPWLAEHGYEIGAHTRSHAALRTMTDAEAQAEIGRNVTELEEAVPGYDVTTFATPYGVGPANAALARSGSHDGEAYEFVGVFGVDAINARSPFDAAFNAFAVPRVGSGLAVADAALAALRANPQTRYTSDGDPERISFPAAEAARLGPEWADHARPYSPHNVSESVGYSPQSR